jgi:hypothetical protein
VIAPKLLTAGRVNEGSGKGEAGDGKRETGFGKRVTRLSGGVCSARYPLPDSRRPASASRLR